MTRRWTVALLPALAALGTYLGLQALADGGAVAERVYTLENYAVLGAAALGSVLGALAFGRGDYLRRAWALTAACYGLLVLGTALFGASSNAASLHGTSWAGLVNGTLTLAANGASVWGTVLVARAWKVAGLDEQVPRRTRLLAMAVSVLLAVVLAGSNTVAAVRGLLAGDTGSLENLASSLGDTACLALIAPILLTAVTLRGGALAWPWALFAASSVGWLLYDGVLLLGAVFHLPDGSLRHVEEAFRVFACVANFSAGWLQRDVLAAPDAEAPAALDVARA